TPRDVARITQLAPSGTPTRAYGTFARDGGTEPSTPRDVGRITQLAPSGTPTRLYGTFARDTAVIEGGAGSTSGAAIAEAVGTSVFSTEGSSVGEAATEGIGSSTAAAVGASD